MPDRSMAEETGMTWGAPQGPRQEVTVGATYNKGTGPPGIAGQRVFTLSADDRLDVTAALGVGDLRSL